VRPGEKSHVKIQGDKDALRFYLDGKLVDDMNLRWWRQNENSRKIAEQRTLVFPLQKTGDFRSKISNLRVSNYLR
jgi:hexosaminidase